MSGMVLIVFVVLVVISIPIASSMAITSFLPWLADSSFAAGPVYLIRSIASGLDSVPSFCPVQLCQRERFQRSFSILFPTLLEKSGRDFPALLSLPAFSSVLCPDLRPQP